MGHQVSAFPSTEEPPEECKNLNSILPILSKLCEVAFQKLPTLSKLCRIPLQALPNQMDSSTVTCQSCFQLNTRVGINIFDITCVHCHTRFCGKCFSRQHFPARCTDYALWSGVNLTRDLLSESHIARLLARWCELDETLWTIREAFHDPYELADLIHYRWYHDFLHFPCNMICEVTSLLKYIQLHCCFNPLVELFLETHVTTVMERMISTKEIIPLPGFPPELQSGREALIRVRLNRLFEVVVHLLDVIPTVRDRVRGMVHAGVLAASRSEIEEEAEACEIASALWASRMV